MFGIFLDVTGFFEGGAGIEPEYSVDDRPDLQRERAGLVEGHGRVGRRGQRIGLRSDQFVAVGERDVIDQPTNVGIRLEEEAAENKRVVEPDLERSVCVGGQRDRPERERSLARPARSRR